MNLETQNDFALLDITKIAMKLERSVVGHTIDYHQSVESTMKSAHALALFPDTLSGAIVVAEEQTAGLGRMQRHWKAPRGQALLVTLILKAPHLYANPALVPMLAGVSVVRAIARVAPNLTDEIGLKWPNDVLLGNDFTSGRKVAGILIETSFRQDAMEYALIGIGINVNQGVEALPQVEAPMPPPTSLRIHLGRVVDRNDLLIALCQSWSDLLRPPADASEIYHIWRNLIYTLGETVTVRRLATNGQPPINGRAVDVTPDGELVVKDDQGLTHVLQAGDVTTRAY